MNVGYSDIEVSAHREDVKDAIDRLPFWTGQEFIDVNTSNVYVADENVDRLTDILDDKGFEWRLV